MTNKTDTKTRTPIQVSPKIIVVDDNDGLRTFVSQLLQRQGFEVRGASGGQEMDLVLEQFAADLIVLDSMMPKEDGLSICKRLREKNGPPIIILSAKSDDMDRILGLDLGADDYMIKPFNPDELVARIKAVLRRKNTPNQDASDVTKSHFFGWVLDNVKRKLTSPEDIEITLSNAEFTLLRVFLDHPGRALTRDQIVGFMHNLHDENIDRAIDTLISRLRRKLNQANPKAQKDEEVIRTIYGIGYMLRPLT